MKKCLLVVLALIASPIPGPATTLPKIGALKTVAGLPGASDLAAPPAVAGAPVAPAVTAAAVPDVQPDWNATPGRLCTAGDPDFKEYRYAERIPYCNRHVTKAMKLEVAKHYGIPESEWPNYEFDHLLPLAIGGDSHVDNLWPEPNNQNDGPDSKDKLELNLYIQMRDGKITQVEAVRQIYAWFGRQPAFKRFAPTGK